MNRQEAYIFYLMNVLKEESECIDKQVVCVLTDQYYRILSCGVNKVLACDQQCDDKENRRCETIHAEIEALDKCRNKQTIYYAYVNLFPCIPCQNELAIFVKEIVVAGPKHKGQVFKNIRLEGDLYKNLLLESGRDKQLSVAQGELAELITCISDYFYRPDKNIPIEELLDEIVDVELMLMQLKTICWKENEHSYNILRRIRGDKHIKLLDWTTKML